MNRKVKFQAPAREAPRAHPATQPLQTHLAYARSLRLTDRGTPNQPKQLSHSYLRQDGEIRISDKVHCSSNLNVLHHLLC